MVQTTLGHYHPPRLINLAKTCQREGHEFHNIELSGSISTYPWFQAAAQGEFSNISLFPDRQLENIPAEEMWSKLRATLEGMKLDVAILMGYSLPVLRQAQAWCEHNRIATVLISDSNYFDKKRFFPFEFLKYLFVHKADAAFVAGQTARDYMIKLGIPKERIAFGCDVVDVQAISRQAGLNRERIQQVRQKWSLPEHYFLFVGRLVPEKNVLGLLEAYEKYLHDDKSENAWHLVICGAGTEQEKIEAYLNNVPAEDRVKVHLSGFIGPNEIVDFYSGASTFILPSLSEPWGLVVNEAMACSLPVIVSNRCGSAFSLVQEGENGWIIDPLDPVMMASVMKKAANMDPEQRAAYGKRSRALINDWDLDLYSRGVIESSKLALAHARKKYKG